MDEKQTGVRSMSQETRHMKKSVWYLTVRGEFSAAHALRHYQGKCENMHGHNYGAELTVRGEKLSSDTELAMDFSEMKKIFREVLEQLDHHILNETPPFDVINPSSENLARYIWKQLEPRFAQSPVELYSVTVSEKTAQSATYREE